MTAGLLAAVGLTGLSSVAVTAYRKRALQRQRIERQLELIWALPTADYRLRALEQLVG